MKTFACEGVTALAAFATAPPPLAVGDQPEKQALSAKKLKIGGGEFIR